MTSLHADDAFLNYYQFSHDPFTPRVPGFKFFPAQRKSVLGQLHHLARYGQLLLLVTGPKGSGKTLLRQALVASTNKQAVHSLVLSGRESASSSGVLKQVASGVESASASLGAILARSGQLALTGQEVYLLVDDAGQLEDEALQTLLSLAAGNGEGRIHVFLFAENDLEPRLAALSEGAEHFHAIELQPYSETETREYLAQRLEGAGQSLDLLTDDQVEEIHAGSGGWPGAINQVARETMIDAMLADRGVNGASGFTFSLPKKHLLALIVVCAAVGAAWFMNTEPVVVVRQPQLSVDTQGEAADEAGPAVEFSSAAVPKTEISPAQPVIREPLAQASGEAEQEDHQGAVAETAVDLDNAAAGEVGTNTPPATAIPLPLPVSEPSKPVSAGAQSAVVKPPVAVSGSVGAAIEPPVAVPAAAPVSVPTAKPVAASVSAPVSKPVSKAPEKTAPKPAVAPGGVPAGADWYKAQTPSRFALQILGSRSEGSAKAFVKQNGGEYRYYMKMHQGAPMYVVTYGVFSSQAAAQAALKTLPVKVQAGKPWPKTFAAIQQEMVKGR